jgi:aspartyl protease family protein
MALSSGARQAAATAAGWALAVGCVAISVVYFSEIKVIAHGILGLPEPGTTRIAEAAHTSPDQARRITGGRMVELRAGSYGHYRTTAEINGRPVTVLVDTGASMVALSFEDAQAAGIFVRDSDFTHRVSTANGFARVAPITIARISVGDITVRDVAGAVMENGKLGTSLLGMSFLGRLQRVDMRSGTLVLQE